MVIHMINDIIYMGSGYFVFLYLRDESRTLFNDIIFKGGFIILLRLMDRTLFNDINCYRDDSRTLFNDIIF